MNTKTSNPTLSMIVACDRFGGFAKRGKIPWKVSADLKSFKEITSDHLCIMGRNTYEDMCEMMTERGVDLDKREHILPNRESYVLSRNNEYTVKGANKHNGIRGVWNSLKEDDQRTVFILGGEKLFIEALIYTNTIHMNIIKGDDFKCDKFFPIKYVQENFQIFHGEETDEMYKMTFLRIFGRRPRKKQPRRPVMFLD